MTTILPAKREKLKLANRDKNSQNLQNGQLFSSVATNIGVASYGALGHVPPLDFQLVILGITRFTD